MTRWLVVLRYVGVAPERHAILTVGMAVEQRIRYAQRRYTSHSTDDHSVAPPNVAWWPPRWPIEDVSDGSRTRRRALPGVLQLFKCATCQIQELPAQQRPSERPTMPWQAQRGMSDGEPKLDEVAERLVAEGCTRIPTASMTTVGSRLASRLRWSATPELSLVTLLPIPRFRRRLSRVKHQTKQATVTTCAVLTTLNGNHRMTATAWSRRNSTPSRLAIAGQVGWMFDGAVKMFRLRRYAATSPLSSESSTVQTCHSQDPADSRPGHPSGRPTTPRTPGRSGTPAGNQPLAQATALHAGARILTEYPSDRTANLSWPPRRMASNKVCSERLLASERSQAFLTQFLRVRSSGRT